MPGLIDSHIHPVIGDLSRGNGSSTSWRATPTGGDHSRSPPASPTPPAGPPIPQGVKALAILVARSFHSVRPRRGQGDRRCRTARPGSPSPISPRWRRPGVRLVGEIGISGVKDPAQAEPMVRWAQAHGMTAVVHTGGASIPGSGVIGAEFVLAVRPDVAAHVNGWAHGPPAERCHPDHRRVRHGHRGGPQRKRQGVRRGGGACGTAGRPGPRAGRNRLTRRNGCGAPRRAPHRSPGAAFGGVPRRWQLRSPPAIPPASMA